MVLFAFESFRAMATRLAGPASMSPGRFRTARFSNAELYVEVRTAVKGEDCLILGSIAPPDERMLSTLLLAHSLKREGARRVTALLPYLAYARHDKNKPGESLATAWVGEITRASGVDDVITVDIHSERARALFPLPVISLSPSGLFAEKLIECGWERATIVAPDHGAIARCAAVQKALRRPGDIPYFEKQRSGTGIIHASLMGTVGRRAVIIDDILDTGATLLSACERLRQVGVQEITIMVTHGLFTGEAWTKLWDLGVTQIFCTDSVPPPPGADASRIVRLSIAPLLERQLCIPA